MNNNDKTPGRPGEGGKKFFSRAASFRRGRRPRGGGQGQQDRAQRGVASPGMRKEEPRKALPIVDCAICHKPIFDLASALGDKESDNPIHFDCALERVAAAETLSQGEKLVYLGAGCFGVVGFVKNNDGAFVVKRRIRWGKEGVKQPWEKDISSPITKI